jgi:uncharacterized membrane protein (UPF0182 family)
MAEPQVFYNQEDLWSLPQEVFFGDELRGMEPYYLIMRLPDEGQEEFVLIMPFTPSNKPNLVGWLAGRSDGPNYGRLTAFTFPKDRQIDGAEQVEAAITANSDFAPEFLAWNRPGSRSLRGNLLVIPVGGSILYAEPVYLQAENLDYPILTTVILASQGQRQVMETSLPRAVNSLLRGGGLAIDGGGLGDDGEPGLGGSIFERLRAELNRMQQSAGDLQDQIGDLSDLLLEFVLSGDEPEPTPTATPSG